MDNKALLAKLTNELMKNQKVKIKIKSGNGNGNGNGGEKVTKKAMKKGKVKPYNVLDLFCGCGGMTQGLVDAGLNVVAGIDVWDKAIDSYKINFDHTAICADLTQLSPKKFDKNYNKGLIR